MIFESARRKLKKRDFLRLFLVPGERAKEIGAMNYKKGQAVAVKDCDGRSVQLFVWKDCGASVLVASGKVLQSLERGETNVWAIGVPRGDVAPSGCSSQKR